MGVQTHRRAREPGDFGPWSGFLCVGVLLPVAAGTHHHSLSGSNSPRLLTYHSAGQKSPADVAGQGWFCVPSEALGTVCFPALCSLPPSLAPSPSGLQSQQGSQELLGLPLPCEYAAHTPDNPDRLPILRSADG